MTEHIDAILFDMGGTLRSTTSRSASEKSDQKDPEISCLVMRWRRKFIRLLNERAKAYRDWTRQELLELNEIELWKTGCCRIGRPTGSAPLP